MAAKINRHRYETIIASLSPYVFTAVELESTGLELRFHLSLDRRQFVSFQKIAEQFVSIPFIITRYRPSETQTRTGCGRTHAPGYFTLAVL